MRCTMTMMSFLFLPLLGGCIQDLLDQGAALAPLAETGASSTSSGEPPTPTTSEGWDPVATVTGEISETSTATTMPEPETTTGAMPNLPPTIEAFAVSPNQIGEAGQIKIDLTASDDVAVVEVRLELDGEKIAELKLADFPYLFDVLSAKYNGDQRIFKVTVLDAEDLSDEREDKVSIQLPSPGVEKCLFEDKEAQLSIISALKYMPDGILAVGSRDTGAGLRLTVWKLDPDQCQNVLWIRSIANWTAKPVLAAMASQGAALDVDAHGNIIVAGNIITGDKRQSYVARLNPDGARLWEKEGQVGDEVAGVAAATAQFKNRVFVVGSRRTKDVPERTDAAIWVYIADGESVFIQPPTILKAPFTPDEFEQDVDNERSEWVRAVVVQPDTGNALAVGEREFRPKLDEEFSRAFTVVVHPLGGIMGTPWTSPGAAFANDAVLSLGICGDKVVAGGWTRDVPANAKPQPIIVWPGTEQHRHFPQFDATQTHGVACDRENKIVNAGTRTSGSSDAQVFTIKELFDPPTWYETGVPDNDGAGAVACDWRGFCGWGGYRSANGKLYAVVRVHHP